MATLVECLVDPDGGAGYDYLSLNAAQAANYGSSGVDFVSNDEYVKCSCVSSAGSADATNVDIDGLTTDATRYLEVEGEGIGDDGKFDSSKYRLGSTSTRSSPWLDIKNTGVTIKALQIQHTYIYSATPTMLYISSVEDAGTINLESLYLKGNVTAAGSFSGILAGDSDPEVNIRNCILEVNTNNGDGSAIGSAGGTSGTVHNNSVIGFYEGIVTTGTMDVSNNMVVDCDTCFINNYSGSNNVSSDATAPGSNSLTNQVATDLMTDPANGDFTLKSGSNAIGAGTDLSAYFTTDITGATRSTPWDIGAFLYSSGGATYNQSTAWAIFNTFQRSSAWAILNSISRDTSWAVFNTHQQDTAWPIKNALNRSSSWKIFNQHDQSTAWPIYNISNQASAWKIFNLLNQESAWRTYNTAVRDTAWRILNLSSVSIDTAWRILNASSSTISTAWAIYNAATRDTAWSIQNQAQADTAWKIINAGTSALQTAWAIYNRADIGSSWRIFNGISVDSSWKVYNFTSRDSAWNILTALQQDTSWQVFSSESLATAWAIDSELIPEPVKTFMAASRTVAFHAPSRTLIFFR